MITARKTGDMTLSLGVLDLKVALYKTAGDQKAEKWDSRLVDAATGLPPEDDEPEKQTTATAPGIEYQGVPVQADPLAMPDSADRARGASGASTAAPEDDDRPLLERQRGFETEAGFVPAEEQLATVDRATALDGIKIGGFVRVEQVSHTRVEGAYYVVPADGTGFAFKTLSGLRQALRKTRRLALIKYTKKKGQNLGVIAPAKDPLGRPCLVILQLTWASQMRTVPATGILGREATAVVTAREVDAMCHLIEVMKEPRASLDALVDDRSEHVATLRDLAERGALHEWVAPEVPEEPPVEAALPDFDSAITWSVERADDFIARF